MTRKSAQAILRSGCKKKPGELSSQARRTIKVLKGYRKRRLKWTAGGALTGTVMGLYGGIQGLKNSKDFMRDFLRMAPIIAMCGAAAGIGVGGGMYMRHSEKVKKATMVVGHALGKEAKKNSSLKDFLIQYPFVIIDAQGNIRGVYRKRFLKVGRIRLESEKILAGEYKPEKKRKTSS